MINKDDKGDCEFNFDPSDDEIEAFHWLLSTLRKLIDNERPNADKAALLRDFFRRWGDHMRKMHGKIHELEVVLEVHGIHETTPERLVRGDLN